MTSTAAAYAARAGEYADVLGSMAAVHPSDRDLVETWARRAPGRVLDAGCGPGHWTAHLASLGVEVRGIDLVPAFVDHARRRFPGVRFDQGSIDDLDEPDASYGGVLAWFSTIHHAPDTIAAPLGEFRRVLRPGGLLALGFFSGPAVEPFDHAVTRAYRWPVAPLRALLDAAGFDVIEVHVREEPGARPVGRCDHRRAARRRLLTLGRTREAVVPSTVRACPAMRNRVRERSAGCLWSRHERHQPHPRAPTFPRRGCSGA